MNQKSFRLMIATFVIFICFIGMVCMASNAQVKINNQYKIEKVK